MVKHIGNTAHAASEGCQPFKEWSSRLPAQPNCQPSKAHLVQLLLQLQAALLSRRHLALCLNPSLLCRKPLLLQVRQQLVLAQHCRSQLLNLLLQLK